MYLLIEVTTVGTPVYESEIGPNIGYDGIETYRRIVDEGALDQYAPSEDIRSCRVLGEYGSFLAAERARLIAA